MPRRNTNARSPQRYSGTRPRFDDLHLQPDLEPDDATRATGSAATPNGAHRARPNALSRALRSRYDA